MQITDIDYINELYWIIMQLSYNIRHAKELDEESINELETFSIDLLNLLEQYKQDKYYDF